MHCEPYSGQCSIAEEILVLMGNDILGLLVCSGYKMHGGDEGWDFIAETLRKILSNVIFLDTKSKPSPIQGNQL